MKYFLSLGWLLVACVGLQADTPNIVVILADDLGFGDVACYNPERGKIATPHIDQLAKQGMRFTDAHSSSGVCSPTRYSLLTGRYHWRTRLQQGIVGVWGKPLIAPDRLTIASVAKDAGYRTACIGKWHLGWDWPITDKQMAHFRNLGGQAGGGGKVETTATPEQIATWKEVFSKEIAGGPTTRGFDHYFGTDVPNWPPYCFIENNRTVGVPSTLLPAADFVKNQASLQGPALPGWQLADVLPTLANKACAFIAEQAQAKKPFLLYVPLTSPHTPIAVAKDWQGKSMLKHPYADFVMQTDAVVGQIMAALNQAGVSENTLVVFTSDNGCAPYIGAKDLEAKGHFPSGPWRGYKADAWEGGHRVPFIVRWPNKVKANSVCSQTICSVDLLATFAEVLGKKLPANAGEDSVSLRPLLHGKEQPIHEAVIHQSSSGVFAVRSGPWKLILGAGDNGTALYDLASDGAESRNLAMQRPDDVKRLRALLEKFIADGRSTAGEAQKNDVAIQIVKQPAKKKNNPKEKETPKEKEVPANVTTKEIIYKKASDAELQLHIHYPKDWKANDQRTAIVFYFGGGWSAWNPTQFVPFARHFADLGCVAICADYRVASKHKTTPVEAVRDAKSAMRYVRLHAKELGIDPQKIVASGGSAGGHLAACTAMIAGHFDEKDANDADASPNALVLFNPVVDLTAFGKRGADAKPISPMQHVRPQLPPMLILHGTTDATVPFKQIEAFADAMKKAKNVCDVAAFDGRGHGFFNSPEFRKGKANDDYAACLDRMTRFLEGQRLLASPMPKAK